MGCDYNDLQELLRQRIFQSSHLMRGATLGRHKSGAHAEISIHAPHARCDHQTALQTCHSPLISIHAPLRGATVIGMNTGARCRISIHAPHARCDSSNDHSGKLRLHISIHAPHAGCDSYVTTVAAAKAISIYAPHARCDSGLPGGIADKGAYFNPRTSCGVRRGKRLAFVGIALFQSTHLMRGATEYIRESLDEELISIHAPHARCDMADGKVCRRMLYYFNPRTPCGVRLIADVTNHRRRISIHAPHARCDCKDTRQDAKTHTFQSTHLMRGATRAW